MTESVYLALSDDVNRALGVLAAQHGCSIAEALAQLRSRAHDYAETLENAALDVLESLRREPDR
jgi:AmiR/NasT family two-component response regulator